ncbi:MFS transporter, partial [Alcanivorax sp. UBA3183]
MPAQRPAPALFVTLGVLYFAQGLPAGLLGKSMPALARDAGLSPEWIGLLALPALPWALKFLWAPWVDRWGSGKPNHRKRWILACVFAVMLVLAITALFPREWLFGPGFALLVVLLFLLNLFSATQDIATDGLATRLLTPDLRGLGNSIQVNGYKIGMILGSGALLIMVGRWGWQGTLASLIVALVLVALVVWRFREPREQIKPRRPVTLLWWRRQLTLFWWRPQMAVWLVILLGYKVGDGFGTRMIKPFLVDRQWSLEAIGRLD